MFINYNSQFPPLQYRLSFKTNHPVTKIIRHICVIVMEEAKAVRELSLHILRNVLCCRRQLWYMPTSKSYRGLLQF